MVRAITVFEAEGTIATHLLGSLARGDGDVLSDVDLWITAPDEEIERMIERRLQIFADIAEIVILPEPRRLSAARSLPRGQWVLDVIAPVVEDDHERIDFLICMSFIGVKKALRGNHEFLTFLSREHERFRATFDAAIEPIDLTGDLASLAGLLRSLGQHANDRQKLAIQVILDDMPRQARLNGADGFRLN